MDFSKLKEYIVVQEYIDVNSIDDIMRLPFSNNLYIAGFFIDFLLGFNSNLPKKLAGITSLSLKDYNCDIIDIPNMPLLKTIQIFLPEDESIDKAFLKQLKSRLYDASIRINSDPLWKILGHDRPTYLPPTPMLNRN